MSFIDQPAARASSISYINDNYLADEQGLVRQLAAEADPGELTRGKDPGDRCATCPCSAQEHQERRRHRGLSEAI